jgi:Domain of unknown function (DUF2935)
MSTLSRRSMMKLGGTGLIAIWGRAVPAIAAQQPAPLGPQSTKPIFLAPEDATDAAIHSKVENLFWCDAMMEHASFFTMLMPGAELAAQRTQAETFQRNFQTQYDRAKAASFDRATSAAFNRSTIELIKPFIEYKQRMRDAQSSGKIRTLVFPMFFDHTAREAERAVARLEKLSSGTAVLSFAEVVDFWSAAMSEHTQFIAHFLDPEEQDLISEALDSSAVFKGFNQGNRDRKLAGGEIVLACEELIDFETSVEDGTNAGRIRSILPANLADHMRRETLKFVDELKRTGSRT